MTLPTGKPLNQVASPALPQPVREGYSPIWQDQFNNILRLYFQQLNNTTNGLLSPQSGGASLFFPHGVFKSSSSQTLSAVDTATLVSFGTASSIAEVLGVSINGGANTDITVLYSGTYRVDVYLQMRSSTGASKDVTVWLRRNSIDVADSARRVTFNANATESFFYGITIELQAEDVLQVIWAANDTNVILEYTAASTPYPAIPSAILSVNHASNVLLD